MSDKKLIAVVGATGAQGGGLVRAILEQPEKGFTVRALTRDPSSEKARALAERGAEVVQADVDDGESLKRAFEGAYGAFCVTFFWDHFSPEKELAQARLMAEAAKATGISHAIWSTLEDTRKKVPLSDDRMPTLMGKYKVPHLDAKGEADDIFREVGVPTTFLLTSFYWDNFIHFGMGPVPGPDGRLAITMPMDDKALPGIAAEDIGRCALGVFQRPELIGETVGIAGEHLTGSEMAAVFTRALGREVVYSAVPPEVFRSFGFPGADDMGNMFQFKRDFNEDFRAPRSLAFSRELNPQLQTFEQWLTAHKDEIKIPEMAVQ
jgi:uncharacterized protein YbjT (DUF2867 family)